LGNRFRLSAIAVSVECDVNDLVPITASTSSALSSSLLSSEVGTNWGGFVSAAGVLLEQLVSARLSTSTPIAYFFTRLLRVGPLARM